MSEKKYYYCSGYEIVGNTRSGYVIKDLDIASGMVFKTSSQAECFINEKLYGVKTYYYFGYEIVRKPHYVDAHKHYDYVITDKSIANGKVFDTLVQAKKFIKDQLYGNSD